MKKGQRVNVFQDPITCKRLEGEAKLIQKHKTENWKQEYWRVKFLSDGFVCDRFINIETH